MQRHCGEREKGVAERAWVTGAETANGVRLEGRAEARWVRALTFSLRRTRREKTMKRF